MRHLFAMAFCASALFASGRGSAEVNLSRINYHGWQGAYRLSNSTVDLVFVPQIGRVMRYGYIGGPNVLWENTALSGKTALRAARVKDWVNYGGDKLWPAPQARWTWPPDPDLDGAAHEVTVLPGNSLRVVTPVSKQKGIRFAREITLAQTGTGVTFRNTMENAGDQDVEWSIWEVSQIRVPDYAELTENRAGHFRAGHYTFKGYPPAPGMLSVSGNSVRFKWNASKSGKIGSDSPSGRVTATLGGVRFTVSASYETGKEYPDDGCGQEIWSNPAPLRYMEMELLGPIRRLEVGDTQSFATRWELARVARGK